eukprot:gene9954-11004_t
MSRQDNKNGGQRSNYTVTPPHLNEEEQYGGTNQPYDEDEANMAEIEQELALSGAAAGGVGGYGYGYGYSNDEVDAQHMAELDQEIQQTERQLADAGYEPVTKSGELSKHAAEFWFPESRNCPCCKGFKHGCACVKGGVTICQDKTCTTAVKK